LKSKSLFKKRGAFSVRRFGVKYLWLSGAPPQFLVVAFWSRVTVMLALAEF